MIIILINKFKSIYRSDYIIPITMLSQFILIISFILVATLASTPYQPQIRTGFQDLTTATPPFSTSQQLYNITFSSTVSWSYEYCLATEQVEIDYSSPSQRYSYDVEFSTKDSSRIVVAIVSALPSKITTLVIRYLLIDANYSSYFTVEHFRYSSPQVTGQTLDKNAAISQLVNCTIAPTSEHYIFMLSLDIIPNNPDNITFFLNSIYYSTTQIQVNISTNISNAQIINKLVFDILIFDRDGLTQNENYDFTILKVPNFGSAGIGPISYYTYDRNLSAYDIFYGISGYAFRHTANTSLKFGLSQGGSDLFVDLGSDQKAFIDFIIFHRLEACDSSQPLSWNTTIQYCQCPDANYQQSTVCLPCLVDCINCIDGVSCQTCKAGYKMQTINSTILCIFDCSIFHIQCSNCSFNSCTTCYDGFELKSDNQTCSTRCGDEKWVNTTENCDDGNVNNYDGCSSTCQLQTDNFICTNTPLAQSDCKLLNFTLAATTMLKQQDSNQVVITYQIAPLFVYGYDSQNWIDMFDQNQLGYSIDSVEYDSTGLLIVRLNYDQNADFTMLQLSITPQLLSSLYGNISSTQVKVPSEVINNLSLAYYSDSIYLLASIVKYISYMLTVAVLIFFIVGNFGAKLAAIQCISLYQLTALLQASFTNMTPTVAALWPLIFSLGATPFFQTNTYYQDSDLPGELKYFKVSRNAFMFINFGLIFLVSPIVIGFIIKCVAYSSKNVQRSRVLHRAWKNAFGTFTLYPLVFLTYGIMFCLAIDLKYFQAGPSTAISLTYCLIFALMLVISIILMQKYPALYGSFKKKFERYNISEYHYIFQCIERVSTAILLVLIGPGYVGVSVVLSIFGVLALFIGIKRPYMLNDWKRAIFIKITAVLLCLTYLGVNLTGQNDVVSLYAPLLILALLLTAIIISIIYSLATIKQFYQDSKTKINAPLSTTECHDLQLRQMEQKLFKFQHSILTGINMKNMSQLMLQKDKWEWDSYPKLYSLDIAKIGIKMAKKEQRIRQEDEQKSEGSGEETLQRQKGGSLQT